jgi:hypothetical protein
MEDPYKQAGQHLVSFWLKKIIKEYSAIKKSVSLRRIRNGCIPAAKRHQEQWHSYYKQLK